MKLLTVELSRIETTEITVEVPDDFDHRQLSRFEYVDALREAAEKLDSIWDKDRDFVEVEEIKVLTGEHAERERREYTVIDLTPEIEKVKKQNAAQESLSGHRVEE